MDDITRMKEIIGCQELTHDAIHTYTRSGWWTREMLPWEHCAMSFQSLWQSVAMRKEFWGRNIYLCIHHEKPYYFGIGLEEPEVTDDLLKNGHWLVYTWAD